MALAAKEKQFIDEAIFLKFNAEEQFTWEHMRRAALKANYKLSDNELIAQEEAKTMFLNSQEMQDYYSEQYQIFNSLLEDNKRDVWDVIYNLGNVE